MLSAMRRKQLPLCKHHHLEFEKGIFSTIDENFTQNLLKTKIPDHKELRNRFTKGVYDTSNVLPQKKEK